MDTNSIEYKKHIVWEQVSLELATLRDFVASSIESLEIVDGSFPDVDRWHQIALSADVSLFMLNHLTAMVDTMAGSPPTDWEFAIDVMQENQAKREAHKTPKTGE